MLLLNMNGKVRAIIDVLGRHMARVDRLGDDQRAVVIRHHLVFALLWNSRYRDAAAVQRESSPIAARLGDTRSKAYSLASDIHVSMMTSPKSLAEFEALKKEAIKATSETTDAHIQNWLRFVIGWEEFHRGRTSNLGSSGWAVGMSGGMRAAQSGLFNRSFNCSPAETQFTTRYNLNAAAL